MCNTGYTVRVRYVVYMCIKYRSVLSSLTYVKAEECVLENEEPILLSNYRLLEPLWGMIIAHHFAFFKIATEYMPKRLR